MADKKVNNNPVESILSFLSNVSDKSSDENQNEQTNKITRKPVPIQDRAKVDINGKELKRKRYNLLLLPSLYEDIKKIAYVKQISCNEAINQALDLYRNTNKEIMLKFNEIEKLKESEEAY